MSIQLEHVVGYCEAVATSAMDGEVDALVAFAQIKAIAAAATDALKVVDPLAIAAAEHYPSKAFEHAGLKFQRKEGSRNFKFDHLPEVVRRAQELKDLQERHKSAALQLEKGMLAATVDGEMVDPARIEYSKPSLTLVA